MPILDFDEPSNGEEQHDKPSAKLAITVFELEAIPLVLRVKAFLINTPQCRIDLRPVSMVKLNRENFPGVPFKINTEDDLLKCALACDVVRSQIRRMQETVPGIYVMKNTTWDRVRDADDLAISGPSGAKLNPNVFGSELVYRPPLVGPDITPVDW